MPDSEKLSKIRQEIDYNTNDFLKILNDKKFKKVFPSLDDFDKLKTAPKGYPKDHPHLDLLKHKSYIVSHPFTDKEVVDKKFVKNAAEIAKQKKLNVVVGLQRHYQNSYRELYAKKNLIGDITSAQAWWNNDGVWV